MKPIGYLALAGAALASLWLVQVLQPTSRSAALFLSGWLLLPYLGLALALIFGAKERVSEIAAVAVAVMVAGAGVLFLIDTIYLHPDPQGGIAVLFTPIYQGVGIAVLLPSCRWLFANFGANRNDARQYTTRR